MSYRLKRIRISQEAIAQMYTEGVHYYNVTKGLPEDIRIFDSWYEKMTGVFVCLIEHKSFPEIKSLCDVPLIEIGIESPE